MGITDTIYNTFFKRSTVYIPFLLVGAYFVDQAVDKAVYSLWERRNHGKLFEHMVIPAAESE